jgi:hypothetical protein
VNRLEEFLQNLDNKNKIMLYLSILIIAVIIYYNFNYNFLNSEITDNDKEIKKLEKKVNSSIKNYVNTLFKLKKEYKNLTVIKNEKIQDLEYLNKRIDLSYLKINDKNFYSLLENILYKSNNLNLTPDFYINKDFNEFKKYIIDIKGVLGFCQEKNLFDFIKFLESRKYCVNIDKFSLEKNNSTYFIRYNIWGIK